MIEVRLTVTPKELADLSALVATWEHPYTIQTTTSEAHTEPTQPVTNPINKVVEEEVKTVVKPTAGKKVKMPGFMRTQAQIDAFSEEEQAKFDKKTEEQLLKEERQQEREAAKAAKQELEDEKKAEKQRQDDEIAAIKEAVTEESTTPPLVKPWNKQQL